MIRRNYSIYNIRIGYFKSPLSEKKKIQILELHKNKKTYMYLSLEQ